MQYYSRRKLENFYEELQYARQLLQSEKVSAFPVELGFTIRESLIHGDQTPNKTFSHLLTSTVITKYKGKYITEEHVARR